MAVAMNWYDQALKDLFGNKAHDLMGSSAGTDCDVLALALTDATPNKATHTALSSITEIGAVGGYTAGGKVLANTGVVASGPPQTFTLAAPDPTPWQKSGAFPQFRYVVLYNSTAVGKWLLAYWDRGSSLNMANDGDTFLADLGTNLLVATLS